MRTGIDELIAGFTAKQNGLVARWQLLAVGITDRHIHVRLANGTLIEVYSGVYRVRGVPYTQELRWLAGVLAGGPESWLSHRAGASFHGYGVRFLKPEIIVAHERDCDLDGIVTHRTRRRHDVITVRGMPVTTKARTALDCAAVMAPDAFRSMIQDAVTGGIVKIEALLATLQHRGGRGVEGTVLFRETLQSGLVDEKIQRKLELLVARIIATCRVPKPVRQHRLLCDDGREVFLDNAWPDRKKAVEAVGLRWHGTQETWVKTRARARSIRASGWELDEYGWYEATEAVDEMRASIEATEAVDEMRASIEAFWEGSHTGDARDPSQNEENPAA